MSEIDAKTGAMEDIAKQKYSSTPPPSQSDIQRIKQELYASIQAIPKLEELKQHDPQTAHQLERYISNLLKTSNSVE